MKRATHAQRGAALLAAMITVTLVATLAAAALWRQWRGVEVEAAERARVQSAWLLTGALDWSRLILSGDYSEDERKRQMVDHLGEPWAVPLAEARLSTFLAAGESSSDTHRDAFLSGEVTDLQSRLNVMNLAVGDANGRQEAYLRFQRLFELLNLRNAELALLRDNLQRAADAMKAAAPDGNDAPLLPRRFDQLAWLGLSPESLQVLRPYLTVLPLEGSAATKVNVNTDLQVVFAQGVREYVEAGKDKQGKGYDPRKMLLPGRDAIVERTKELIREFGSDGKAWN